MRYHFCSFEGRSSQNVLVSFIEYMKTLYIVNGREMFNSSTDYSFSADTSYGAGIFNF